MLQINSIYDYLRWRGFKLFMIWAMVPLVSCVLFMELAGDRLNDLSPTLRMVCVVLLVGTMGGGPLTYFILMFRTPCPRCRRALGFVALLGRNIVRDPSARCPHCGIDIFAPMDGPAIQK